MASSYTTFEQFIRFSTDAYGLERTLRMVQAILQVLAYVPLPLEVLIALLSLAGWDTSSLESGAVQPILLGLRSQVALSRRFFRMFRFLDAFHQASSLYLAPGPLSRDGRRSAEIWLDITGQSFNGMYLLLELLTLVDAMDVKGLAVWGAARERSLNVEAQRFWFLALVCGIIGALVKMVNIMAYKPVPETGEGFGDGSKVEDTSEGNGGNEGKETSEVKQSGHAFENGKSDALEWKEDRERLRRSVTHRREQRKRWRQQVKTRSRGIVRRLLADVLDLAVPGAVLGWISASPGTVGVLMLGSTYLTGQSVWERCGRDLANRR